MMTRKETILAELEANLGSRSDAKIAYFICTVRRCPEGVVLRPDEEIYANDCSECMAHQDFLTQLFTTFIAKSR